MIKPKVLMMKINLRVSTLFLMILFSFTSLCVNAQSTDTRSWLGVGVAGDINKKIAASLDLQHRSMNNISSLDKVLFEPGITYAISKELRIGVSYRISIGSDEKTQIEWSQRASTNLRYKIKLDDFDIKLKTTLQYSLNEFNSSWFDTRNDLVNRNAIQVNYNWFGKKIKPMIGSEMYSALGSSTGFLNYKYRLKTGFSYPINDQLVMDVFYLYEREFNVVEPQFSQVIGVSINFDI